MPFKGLNDFFFIVVGSCSSSLISREPALSLLISIIFLCPKKMWIIWVIQMFTKADSNMPAIEDSR